MQYFDAFDLEPALSLDAEDLKKRFYERSRQWHPDKFSRASIAEQEKALEMTAVLNDAFRTLRDPVARAEYFLKEKGFELSKDAPAGVARRSFRAEYGAGRIARRRRVGASSINRGSGSFCRDARFD